MILELKIPESNRNDAGIPRSILQTPTLEDINVTAGRKPRAKNHSPITLRASGKV
jgi:hypothetical protein